MLVKNSPNKKGYIGFVGSQPMLLLFDACLNIWCKSNNIGCDPTYPMYPFLFGEFFLLALVRRIREYGSTLYIGLSRFPHRANTNRYRCNSLASEHFRLKF